MKASLRLIALLSLWGVAAQVAASMPVPDTMNYQGRMKTSGGSPVPNGSHSVIFRLYDDPSTGALIWSESYTGPSYVTTNNGLFNVTLGSLNPLSASYFSQGLWLQIEWYNPGLPGWEILSPRHELTMAPYAYVAKGMQAPALINGGLSYPNFSLTVNQNNSFNGGGAIYAYSPASATAAIYAYNTDTTVPSPSSYPGMGLRAEGSIGVYGRAYFDNGIGVMGSVPSGSGMNGTALVGINNAAGLGLYVSSINSGGRAIEAWGYNSGISVTAQGGQALEAYSNVSYTASTITNAGPGVGLTVNGGIIVKGQTNDGIEIEHSGSGTHGVAVWGGSGSKNGIEVNMTNPDVGYGAVLGSLNSTSRGFGVAGLVTANHPDSVAVRGYHAYSSDLLPNTTYGFQGAAGTFENTQADGVGLIAKASNALSGGKGIGIYAEGYDVGVSATAKDSTGFGVGIWGIVPGYGGGVAGVIGQVHGDSATVSGGRGGVVAVNSKLSITNGSPAVALYIDGAIAVNSARSDRIAGVVSIGSGSFSSAGTNTLSAVGSIASASIKSNSLVYLTVSSGAAATADVVSVRLTSVVDGTASFRVHIMRGSASPASAAVDIHYLIINR